MARRTSLVEGAETLAKRRGVQPLRLTIDSDSNVTLYAAPKPEERDDRVFPHMWVHRLSIGPTRGRFSAVKDEWVGLSNAPKTERTLHEWSTASEWAALNPPVSFETKQNLFYDPGRTLRDWRDEVWPDDQVKRKFEIWTEVRDAEHRNDIISKRDPKRVVNPAELRIIGFIYASLAGEEKARIARIYLELDMATALYHFATGDFKQQVLEEYARPYEPACRSEQKRILQKELGFRLSLVGVNLEGVIAATNLHGPPLRPQEFRSALRNQFTYFRRSRAENGGADESSADFNAYILPTIRESDI